MRLDRPVSSTSASFVERFGLTERIVHWSYAFLFALLLGTGFVLWVPALGAIGRRDLFRQVHIVAGLALVVVPLAVALAGNRRSMRRTVSQLSHLGADDAAFLLRRPVSVSRFNGGQKLNALWSGGAALLFFVSGAVMWQWTRVPATWRAGASAVHDALVVASVVVLAGHVYLATVNPSTRHSMLGITTGRVRRAWAAEHHPGWVGDALGQEASGPTRPSERPSPALGRRIFLGVVGAGVAAMATGGRWVPRIEMPSSGGWRIYNVAGRYPRREGFRLRVDGLVERPLDLDLEALLALPHVEQTSDFECVTGWRVDDVRWGGVRLAELFERAGVLGEASHVTFHSRDGVYTDSLSIGDAVAAETMLATAMDGGPLPLRHGAPVRLVVPSMYGYKSVKWVGTVELTNREVIGYWEQRGYASDARIDTSGGARAYAGRRERVPGTGYTIELPDGWRIEALPGGGAVFVPTGDVGGRVEVSVVVRATPAEVDRETTQSLLAGLERAGLERVRYGAIRAGKATADTLSAEDGSGQRFLFAYLGDGRRLVEVQGQAPVEAWSRWAPWFEQLAASVRHVDWPALERDHAYIGLSRRYR